MKLLLEFNQFILEAGDTYSDYPAAAKANAKKAIDWKEKYGRDEVKGGTAVGWQRAHQLAKGEKLSRDVVSRMAQFNRHRKNSKIAPEYKDEPWKDNGYIAWLIWGGDEGVDWAMKKMDEIQESITTMKRIKLFEQFIIEGKSDVFPEYNNGLATGDYKYMKAMKALLSKIEGISEYDDMDTTSNVYIKSTPGTANIDLTKDIQKALKGFDDNLDLDNITSNIGKPGQISPNDQQKGIVTYNIPKKVDWWTLKRAAGPEKPSTETQLTPEIVSSLLDKMAQVSTTQDELADTNWTSLEDFLGAAKDHMSATNYKKFYKEAKKKYPKIK